MSDFGALSTEVTILVRIDTAKHQGNVKVDLGIVPPLLAIDALRQAYEAVCDLQECETATVWFRGEPLELELEDADDE